MPLALVQPYEREDQAGRVADGLGLDNPRVSSWPRPQVGKNRWPVARKAHRTHDKEQVLLPAHPCVHQEITQELG